MTGGGAKSALWLQMVADVLETRLERPAQNQGAAYGAALLALQGVGVVEEATRVAEQSPASTITPGSTEPYQAALHAYREVPL